MYIVKLNPNLLEVNARVKAGLALTEVNATATPVSGTVHNGYNQATAQIAAGTTGTVTVSFEIVVLSIASATFDAYRTQLQQILGHGTEHSVAKAAGITPPPPPAPASLMAGYADELFSEVVFGGEPVTDQSRAFSTTTPASARMLSAMRLLDVTEVSFSGTLTASSASPATTEAAAYIPITAVEFADGLTIPFAGYSGNVLVDDGTLKQLDIPGDFWSEPPGADAPPA